MTRREITDTFRNDMLLANDEELTGLLHLGADEHFADEAGDEFLLALSQVGLSRIYL